MGNKIGSGRSSTDPEPVARTGQEDGELYQLINKQLGSEGYNGGFGQVVTHAPGYYCNKISAVGVKTAVWVEEITDRDSEDITILSHFLIETVRVSMD